MDLDKQRIGTTLPCVVPRETLAEPAHLHADDRVGLGVERITFPEYGGAQDVLLEMAAAARQRFVNGKTQKFAKAVGILEVGTRQDLFKVGADERFDRLRPRRGWRLFVRVMHARAFCLCGGRQKYRRCRMSKYALWRRM